MSFFFLVVGFFFICFSRQRHKFELWILVHHRARLPKSFGAKSCKPSSLAHFTVAVTTTQKAPPRQVLV